MPVILLILLLIWNYYLILIAVSLLIRTLFNLREYYTVRDSPNRPKPLYLYLSLIYLMVLYVEKCYTLPNGENYRDYDRRVVNVWLGSGCRLLE